MLSIEKALLRQGLFGIVISSASERINAVRQRIREYLEKDQGTLVLDLENLRVSESKALDALTDKLRDYRRRIRIRLPRNYLDHAAQFLLLAQIFRLYQS